jgi:hypothetical protein
MRRTGFAADGRQTLRLAVLATLRFVLELLVVEEELFACREDEVLTAVNAFQGLVLEFHVLHPSPDRASRAMDRTPSSKTRTSLVRSSFFGLYLQLPMTADASVPIKNGLHSMRIAAHFNKYFVLFTLE